MERPKRRKYRDNPYTLEFKENKYYIRFKDITNNIQIVEVSEEVYKIFDKSELEDISQMHEYERHIEHSELTDITLNRRAKNKSKIVIEQIKNAFNILTETQKRRIKLYYFEELNFKQIAFIEKCDESSVRESIYKGIEKIKKYLN